MSGHTSLGGESALAVAWMNAVAALVAFPTALLVTEHKLALVAVTWYAASSWIACAFVSLNSVKDDMAAALHPLQQRERARRPFTRQRRRAARGPATKVRGSVWLVP